jgi:diguanylate cyclase (GGDEF)-like protein
LLVREHDHLVVQASRKIPRFIVARTAIPMGFGIAGWVAQQRQPLLIGHQNDLPVGLTLRSQGYRTPSFVSVPISLGRRVIGVVNVADRLDGGSFTRADLDSLVLICRQAADVTRFHQQASDALRQSRQDPLTELPNHHSLHQRLGEELERSHRYGTALGLMIIDVRTLNPITSHQSFHTDDQLLKTVADILRSELRVHDVPFRYGDNEFVILLPNTDATQLLFPARRVEQRLAQARLPRRSRRETSDITIRIGLVAAPQHGESAFVLLTRAHEALTHARGTGAQFELWRPGIRGRPLMYEDAVSDDAVTGP